MSSIVINFVTIILVFVCTYINVFDKFDVIFIMSITFITTDFNHLNKYYFNNKIFKR